MQINTTHEGLITILLSEEEAVDLLLSHIRFGIEHKFTRTIPITVDMKTTAWEWLFNWAKLKRQEPIISVVNDDPGTLYIHGNGFTIRKE